MQTIQSIKLKDITSKIGSGATPRGGKNSYITEGIALIRSLNVYDFSFAYEGLAFIDEKQASQLENVLVEGADILLNITGASVCRCCLVPKNVLPARVNQHVSIVRIKPRAASARYALYAINSPYNKRRLLAIAQGGATREALTKEKIENFEIPLPPLPTQLKIAAILSAYDDLIENNLRRIKILEEMAQTLYREWFVKFRFPGHQKVKMVDSPLGKIPEGWEAKRVGDIAEDMRRGVKPSEVPPDTPYIGLEHLPRKSIALSQWGFAGDVQSTKFEFKRGEILFGKIRPYFHKVGFAPIDGICSSDTIVIADKDHKWYPLLLCCVSSEDFVAHTTQTSKGTKMPRADWEVLTKYPVPVPPPSLLTNFNSFLENNLGLIENLIFRNRNLRQTRDLLLPKLISGELDVSELDIETVNDGL